MPDRESEILHMVEGRPEWQQRLLVERFELKERVGKLSAFMMSKQFGLIDVESQSRLRRQAFYMHGYLGVLDERVAEFGGS